MMKYEVVTREKWVHRVTYFVEAESEEHARELVTSGLVDWDEEFQEDGLPSEEVMEFISVEEEDNGE
jgi:hypothetical protein